MNIYIHSYIPSGVSYYKDGRKEYEKRLTRYCKIKHNLYKNEKQLAKAMDSFRLLSEDAGKNALIHVTSGLRESNMDSPALADYIQQKGVQGVSNLHYILGFPQDESIFSTLSTDELSISHMEIPSDLLSLILEEQIYRAFRIINKEPYHK